MQNPALIIVTNINNLLQHLAASRDRKGRDPNEHELFFTSPSENQGGDDTVQPKGNLLQVA